MKIKVINNKLPLYDEVLKVKNINYDMVVAERNGERLPLSMEDVELIPENKYEELIERHKDILKVKLNREISPELYRTLIELIEGKIDGRLEALEVLNDNYKISKRGIFEKNMILVVNNSLPLEVIVVGTKYSKEFSVTFRDINLQSFIEGCSESIMYLKKEIGEKQKSINRYKSILKEVIKNSINPDEECRVILG